MNCAKRATVIRMLCGLMHLGKDTEIEQPRPGRGKSGGAGNTGTMPLCRSGEMRGELLSEIHGVVP